MITDPKPISTTLGQAPVAGTSRACDTVVT
jgi:hypothetical protein